MRSRLVLVGLLATACTSDDQVGLDGSSGLDDTVDCDGADPYVAGIEVSSTSGRSVSLLDADPAPPDVGDNTWTVSVTDELGPASGLQLQVRPWMPLHGHGVSPPTYASTDHGDGTYTIETFDLIMPGLWELTVDVGVGEGVPDEALFRFCAEG